MQGDHGERPGVVVTFPDPALVAELADLEAPRPHSEVVFSWARSIGWAVAGALAGSALFAVVAVITEGQFGLVSIAIGLLAGLGAARGGRSRQAQIVGAAAALVGYFVGQILAIAAIVGARFFDLPLEIHLELLRMLFEQTFTTMDALFLGIAVWEGWRIPQVRT